MPCDTIRRPRQTLSERKAEVRATIDNLAKAVASGRVKPVIGKQGAIAFIGIEESERNRVTDACVYRGIMVHGNALARAKIAQAEALAGVRVNKQVVGQGVHSHDSGKTWHAKG